MSANTNLTKTNQTNQSQLIKYPNIRHIPPICLYILHRNKIPQVLPKYEQHLPCLLTRQACQVSHTQIKSFNGYLSSQHIAHAARASVHALHNKPSCEMRKLESFTICFGEVSFSSGCLSDLMSTGQYERFGFPTMRVVMSQSVSCRSLPIISSVSSNKHCFF